ncbi:putative 4-amino-4-deoxychorismate lyase [Streptomyces sp. NBRC 110611]|uniref:endolytic transglycosylase MltG n=1 Tax=Streptomyces sp. NBRC 110611 TaxID=1621259 RepID=UPI000837050D|nr:endolytic transglycosylase MltG [Streptomyces sp. NBRC 110611]GAU66073.1 putative 4-amino-4-deoxychorismate lyase [Streptomyces sp. NBRC 110611]
MTEYGRGYGSEPWHPDDPLYGDQGSYGSQAQQPQWGGQPSVPQQYRDPQRHPQQQYHGGGGWDGSQGGHPTQGGQPPYGGPYDAYGRQVPADPYAGAGQDYPGQGYAGQDYPGQDYYGHGHQDPYPPQHAQSVPQQMPPHPRHEQPYPPQQYEQPAPPSPPHQQDAMGDDWRDGPERPRDPERPREPGPEHAFFADDDEDGRPDGDPRERRGKRNGTDREDGKGGRKTGRAGKGGKKKRRSGTACLIVTLLLAGTVGAVGYFGYDFLKARFGSAPDYEGAGSGDIQIEIPKDSPLVKMGQILAEKGVIKSAGAFTEAAEENSKAKSLQPGTYSLRKAMSAAAAIELMLDPKSRNGLTIREGLRAGAVYELIDKKLKLKPGTTKDVAKSEVKSFGLPAWAVDAAKVKDPLEGFLYPSTYSVGANAKPAAVLTEMVARAKQVYGRYDLEANARKLRLDSPIQLLTVASLTQAEGKYKHDFDKVARVVYNRLKPDNTETYGLLDFDSTVNYAKAQSTLDTGSVDDLRKFNDPYNTYKFKGLPPGPIGNPGEEALKSAINPAEGNWYYFVSINPEKTLFAATNEEHERNRRIYEREREKAKQ